MKNNNTIYNFEVEEIGGKIISLDKYKGKVILITNTASKCGLVSQYDGLQKLYDKYKDQGFEVLAFPSNNFLGQEPLQGEALQSFCTLNFNTSFPVFERVNVKGRNVHPLFKFLASRTSKPKWNFHKYLIDREGKVVTDFLPITNPESSKIVKLIEKHLNIAELVKS